MKQTINPVVGTLGIVGLATILIFPLWQQPYVLVTVIIALFLFKHRLFPIKFELHVGGLVAVAGLLIEALIVNYAHPWIYSIGDLWGVPIWIPFYWALLASGVVTIYNARVDK